MDLGSVLSRVSKGLVSKKSEPSSFLAVKISSTSILATIWIVENSKVVVGEVGSAKITDNKWETLLHAADQAVSQAIKDEPIPAVKTVFAVPHDWVSDGKITSQHLQSLRQLCKELDLSPQGFVVVTEALENFYKATEGAPLTAILIGIDGSNSSLTVIRAGKNLGTATLSPKTLDSKGIPAAVEMALENYTSIDVLPSRVILFNGQGDLQNLADELTAHHWAKKLPFLHFPKVEIAPAELVVKAVAVAGGIQMGGKFEPVETEAAPETENVKNVTSQLLKDKLAPNQEIKDHEFDQGSNKSRGEILPEIEEVSAGEAGFVEEGDNGVIGFSIKQQEIRSQEKTTETPLKHSPLGQLQEMTGTKETKHDNSKLILPKINFPSPAIFNKVISQVQNMIPTLTSIIKRRNQPGDEQKFRLTKRPIIAVIVILLALFSTFFAVIYYFPKVDIIITVSPREFDHQMEVAVVTDGASTATQSAILTGQFIDVSELGTKKGVASGKKLVGDKAKGSVTIYSVSSGKTFPAGTTITSLTGPKFTLDHEVSVASGDAITPATISTTVTAIDIGDTFNLPSGTKFSISNLPSSQYLAKNDTPLTGGSSHQATVVTKQDQDRLFATLSAELTNQAKIDLSAKVETGQNLLPNAITSVVSKKRFSKDIDFEADTVSLDLTMDFRGIVFSKSDLVSLFVQRFNTDIPPGLALNEENVEVEVVNADSDKKNNAILTIRLVGKLLPIIDKNELVEKISGKSVAATTLIFEGIPNIVSSVFETKPRIFSPLEQLFLPWRKENIQIEIVTE